MTNAVEQESAVEDSEESTKSGGVFWKPQLHFVWRYLLDQYLPGPNSGNLPRGSFQEFFLIAVDGMYRVGISASLTLTYDSTRIVVFHDCITTTETLGFPSISKGSKPHRRGAHANAFHKKFHEIVDQPSF